MVQRISAGFAARGLTADVRAVTGSALAKTAATFVGSKAADDERRTLVVGGGDGTVGLAASLLARTGIVLGVLPLGTLNHFARDIGLLGDLEGAMDVIAKGDVRVVDLAEVNGRIFINNSSIGVYPLFVAERTAEQRKRSVGKFAAIWPAVLCTLRASSWRSVRIVADGAVGEHRTPCVFVGNNIYDLAALGRRNNLSGGKLCVYVVKRQTWAGLLMLPFRALLGRIDIKVDVERIETRSLEISLNRLQVRVAADGETFECSPPLRYRTMPGALQVLGPKAAVQSPS